MYPSAPSSPPFSPRQRLTSLFNGSSGRVGSPALSPPLTAFTTDTQQEPSNASDSRDQLQRTRSRRLSRLTSPFAKTLDASAPLRSLPDGACASPASPDVPHLELVLTGSALDDVGAVGRKASAYSPPASASRPTSPFKSPFFREYQGEQSSPVSGNPPLSPRKRAGPLLFNRSRRDSTVTTQNDGYFDEKSSGISSHPSRPTSPRKRDATVERSPSPPKRRTVQKSMIGLPTNFKHTSGGSSAPLQNAIQLAGLAAAEGNTESKFGHGREAEQAPPHLQNRARGAIATDPHSPQQPCAPPDGSLADIQGAFNGDLAKITNPTSPSAPPPTTSQRRSPSPSAWVPVIMNRMDMIKEVPSGFIQRFENAGELPMLGGGGQIGLPSDSRLSGEMFGKADNTALTASSKHRLLPTTCHLPSSRSPPGSPTKMSHRKAVPKVMIDEEEDHPSLAPEPGELYQPQDQNCGAGRRGADEKHLAKGSPCVSAKSQEWSITLAEISAALKA